MFICLPICNHLGYKRDDAKWCNYCHKLYINSLITFNSLLLWSFYNLQWLGVLLLFSLFCLGDTNIPPEPSFQAVRV